MSEHITDLEFLDVMIESFSRGQKIRFIPSGNSMQPMLNGVTDKVTFAPKPERLKKYDVAFYHRENGQLVMHRVVGFDKDGSYIFSGDGQYSYEHHVKDENILALMVAFTHNGFEHSVDEFSYRMYIRRMMLKKRLRILAEKIYHKFKRK